MNIKFGQKDIPFVYKGSELVYPNPIKDGLLLWYDFRGITNQDTDKEIAKDLSGNGNDGSLENFNFTESSGYDKNSLLFDGVDDKILIPELDLDETAMSVEMNGKTYVYDGDKVVSVDEDGRVEVGNKNLFPSFHSWGAIGAMTSLEDYKASPIIGSNQSLVITIEVKPNTDYTITFNSDHMRYYLNGIEGETSENLSTEGVEGSKIDTFNTGRFSLIRMTANSWSERVYHERSVWDLKLEEGSEQTTWSPAQEDFSSSNEIVHSPLSSLQLYNRPLTTSELLHNIDSPISSELKEGKVVQDGLILHYDFTQENNGGEYKEKAFDYSGNQNHGILQNFAYADGSGYQDGGLVNDGIDDAISGMNISEPLYNASGATFSITTKALSEGNGNAFLKSKNLRILQHFDFFAISIRLEGIGLQSHYSYIEMTETSEWTVVLFLDHYIMYLNGVEIVNEPYREGGTWDISNTTSSTVDALFDDSYKGVTHSFKAYNRPLTAEEIQHNYEIEKNKIENLS